MEMRITPEWLKNKIEHAGGEENCEVGLSNLNDALCGDSIIRRNLMTQEGYAPYCGNDKCKLMPRTRFVLAQFQCPHCEWKSSFPNDFIRAYKRKWNIDT